MAPTPPADAHGSWPLDLATAAATGAVTAWLPSHRWSRPSQWALHGGFGALAAGALVVGVRMRQGVTRSDGTPVSTAQVAALAAATGALTTAVSRGGQGADRWVEDRLTARGVRRPRLWMGVGAAVASLAVSALERRRVPDLRPDPRSNPGPKADLDGAAPAG